MPNWEYIAAFFDGEGTAGIYLRNAMPHVTAALFNKEKLLLESIQVEVQGVMRINERGIWKLDFSKKTVTLPFLLGIQPFVRHKWKKLIVPLCVACLEHTVNKGEKVTDHSLLLRFKLLETFEEVMRAQRRS
jgi:hypothetical protein